MRYVPYVSHLSSVTSRLRLEANRRLVRYIGTYRTLMYTISYTYIHKILNEEAEYKRGVAGDISASRKKMAFARVSNKKKDTHCTCILHSITVFIELHTIHKRHNNVTEFIF